MQDTYKHKGLRRQLVMHLNSLGIEDQNVLSAIEKIPRHFFIDSAFEDYAYQNRAFPIGEGQTISHPYTVAYQTELLQIKKGEKVLEVGTGSGFQTAVLVAMGANVYTIERFKYLHDFSKRILKKINLSPKYQVFGDGYKGLESFAPFDKIIVTAGSKEIPSKLLSQLKVGGIMIIPIGEDIQIMTAILRLNDTQFEKMEYDECQFVPMLKNKM